MHRHVPKTSIMYNIAVKNLVFRELQLLLGTELTVFLESKFKICG